MLRPDPALLLRGVARRLVALKKSAPELFERFMPLCDEDMETLREIAEASEEKLPGLLEDDDGP
jgi:hypothetical protein